MPNPPNRPILPKKPDPQNSGSKPYDLVPFPAKKPDLKPPVGHDRYCKDLLHGKLTLRLTVKTPVHISTGILVMGTDIGERAPLIQTMTQGQQQKLIIPGSSFKGVVRSIYEAITNSTLAVVSDKDKMPPDRLPCRKKDQLCPASLVFGALNWQGLIHFTDAICEQVKPVTGSMRSLYAPSDKRKAYFKNGKAIGRKFYYNAVEAVSKGGVSVQQAGTEYQFKTTLQFKNLSFAQFGTLLVSLGQDPNYAIALKVGGGKPVGMGTMKVEIEALEQPENWKQRYHQYTISDSDRLTDQARQDLVNQALTAAHDSLIEKQQLEKLAQILKWPTNYHAPEESY
ncbi:RAMP superfamily CRISPR-associated protein [Roseofilum sp. BLCC_M154]|uniref:RAMP superfamily CRISPR-associated protein n=1 Tax=Roseofilum acuticapitatum BLCC-M154 TaxID=3022444 RepID=A0ABT7B221_9CYAN|nr:RAMP superfamily CRISPR-associated protein [Roseofilum acuticapitatum]MDJ1172358.1 RAMP superfamily CRISPR-associated protein [Roseofilum acuticapitatum BLCC-M154]